MPINIPVTVIIECGTGRGDGADDGGQQAGHSVKIVHAASVVDFEASMDSRLNNKREKRRGIGMIIWIAKKKLSISLKKKRIGNYRNVAIADN